jgi:hypothetical protein
MDKLKLCFGTIIIVFINNNALNKSLTNIWINLNNSSSYFSGNLSAGNNLKINAIFT